jgi:hypothetical protein
MKEIKRVYKQEKKCNVRLFVHYVRVRIMLSMTATQSPFSCEQHTCTGGCHRPLFILARQTPLQVGVADPP